jgi:hypothetical protein
MSENPDTPLLKVARTTMAPAGALATSGKPLTAPAAAAEVSLMLTRRKSPCVLSRVKIFAGVVT